ncbi:MAG TPA: copper resistance CopC family protein [Geobacteraceae bacterium]|nr:copper resistance CopC family protein [Geobacteraceae bacterium]
MPRVFFVVIMLALAFMFCGKAWAHAFPEHCDPKVGAKLTASPEKVRIWFDGALEPVFSTIMVHDATGRMVDKRDSRVDPADATLLEVSVPQLPPGTYRVIWSVVARDGHRTSGDYTFVVK